MSETAKCKCGRPIHENFGDQRMYYGRYNHVYENGQRDSTHYWHKAEPASPAQVAPQMRGRHNLLHRLWTKAVGTPDYDKSEWTELERMLVNAPAEPQAGAQVPPPRLQYQMWKGDNGLDYVDMRDYRSLEARNKMLEDALRAFVDDEECELDHHGYCQTHGSLHSGPCDMVIARAALEGRER